MLLFYFWCIAVNLVVGNTGVGVGRWGSHVASCELTRRSYSNFFSYYCFSNSVISFRSSTCKTLDLCSFLNHNIIKWEIKMVAVTLEEKDEVYIPRFQCSFDCFKDILDAVASFCHWKAMKWYHSLKIMMVDMVKVRHFFCCRFYLSLFSLTFYYYISQFAGMSFIDSGKINSS